MPVGDRDDFSVNAFRIAYWLDSNNFPIVPFIWVVFDGFKFLNFTVLHGNVFLVCSARSNVPCIFSVMLAVFNSSIQDN